MISSPRSPSTWLSIVSAATTPSRPPDTSAMSNSFMKWLLFSADQDILSILINQSISGEPLEVPSDLYLSASEGAGRLNVSLPTLYAYVSRGMIRSEPGSGRERRYRAEDIERLIQRRE